MRKNKHFYTILCLVLGVVMLTTAAVANYDNANGYTAYKNSLKKLLVTNNFTAELSMQLLYNDEVIVSSGQLMKYNPAGPVTSYERSNSYKKYENSDPNVLYDYERESWIVKNPDGPVDGSEYLYYDRDGNVWSINRVNSSGVIMENNGEISDKVIRFVEALADTFVGDLKNNIVLVSDKNGEKNYQIILRGNQLPEFVTAGFSLLYTEATKDQPYNGSASADQYDNPVEKFFYTVDEPVIDSAKTFVTLDSDGRLKSQTIEGTIMGVDSGGKTHTITLRIQADLSDYDTTDIEMPVIPETDEVRDYSIGDRFNDWSYSVTKDGYTKTYVDVPTDVYEETVLEPLPVEKAPPSQVDPQN